MKDDDVLIPASELPATRILESSARYLTDGELLALVLRGGPAPWCLSRARELLVRHGTLANLAQASPAELTESPGVGQSMACALLAMFEIARRMSGGRAEARRAINSPAEAVELFLPMVGGRLQEEFHIALLDAKNRLIRCLPITVGLVNRTQIHPREVFRPAIQHACTNVLLVHNHPSGDPTPSVEDIASTRQLVEAGKIVGISVVDHVVIGERVAGSAKYWVSFREQGLL